jgi:hypothetical protein
MPGIRVWFQWACIVHAQAGANKAEAGLKLAGRVFFALRSQRASRVEGQRANQCAVSVQTNAFVQFAPRLCNLLAQLTL